MTKKEVKIIKENKEQNYKKSKCDVKSSKSPWVSEQDEMEFKANALANELDNLFWNLTDG